MTNVFLRGFRRIAVVTAVTTLGLTAAPAAAQAESFPSRVNLPRGFQPEGITAGRGTQVFAGSLANGAIWRGDVRTGQGAVLVPGVEGRVAVGIDYDSMNNRIWVAGGTTGAVTVYDAGSGAELARYTIAGSGFLNDLVVTRQAVYVTDSNVQRLVVVPLGRGGALPAADGFRLLPLTGGLQFTAGFNNNGIVALNGGRTLVVVQSSTRSLFRVDAATGLTRKIDLTGGALQGGDGLEIRDRRTLYVMRGAPNAVVQVRLSEGLWAGTVTGTLTTPGLDVPTTGTFVGDRLYLVNARFGTTPGPNVNYWIRQLPNS